MLKNQVVDIEKEDGLFTYFMYNPTPMWLFDPETYAFLEVNEAAIQQYGYTKEQFLSMTILDIRPLVNKEHVRVFVATHNESFERVEASHHLRADGSSRWASISLFHARYKGKSARLVTATDITKLVEQRQELETAKQELENVSLVAQMTDNKVLITDKFGQIEWVNQAFIRRSGYTQEEAIGKLPTSLLHGPRSSAIVTNRIKEAIKEGNPFKEEIIHYTKDGQPVWMLIDGQPVKDEAGNVLHYVMVDTDITGLKESEIAIRRSEERMHAFLNSSNSLHAFFDPDLNLQAYNKVAIQYAWRILHKQLQIGMHFNELMPAEAQELFLINAQHALAGINTIKKEVQVPGTDLWWEVFYNAVYDSFGHILGMAFTAMDITERKNAADRIALQNQALRDVAWKQSHVVRAPLANIMLIGNLIKDGDTDPQLINSLLSEAAKLDTIVKDMVETASSIKKEGK